MKKSKKLLALAGIFLVVAIALCAGYLSDYYRADTQAIEAFTNSAGVSLIPGGCHAYFGMYGLQKGDGTPSISNTRQIQQTAQAALALMGAL